MAKVSSAYAIDMSVADFSEIADARGRLVNDHTIRLNLFGDVTVVKGDFDFNKKGELVGGTANFVDFGFGPYDGSTWAGVKISLKQWDKVAATKTLADDAALLAKILAKDDVITAGRENDILSGGGGNDTITGGWGADDISGGTGADVFKYTDSIESTDSIISGVDEIFDFSRSDHDRISLRDVGDIDFIGSDEFSGAFGEARYRFEDGQTIIEVRGPLGSHFMEIRLHGEIALTDSDFIL